MGRMTPGWQTASKRIPQRGLFEESSDDAEPSRPLTADAGVADGARIHLLHKHDRPYFFGIDSLGNSALGGANEKISAEGFASQGFEAARNAASNTQYMRALPEMMR